MLFALLSSDDSLSSIVSLICVIAASFFLLSGLVQSVMVVAFASAHITFGVEYLLLYHLNQLRIMQRPNLKN